jgi:hypothetical protein
MICMGPRRYKVARRTPRGNRRPRPAKPTTYLAPIHGWFTEGFDTPDLEDAKALLDELA